MLKLVSTSSGTLFISPLPDKTELESFEKFDIIWNLTDNESYADFEKEYAHHVYLGNIKDYDIPKDTQKFEHQLSLIINCLRLGGSVLIHCLAGHGRTGMALACVLIGMEYISAETAIKQTNKLCNGPETEDQKEFVRRYAKSIDL
jgi:protein-tyrosine phosphatase